MVCLEIEAQEISDFLRLVLDDFLTLAHCWFCLAILLKYKENFDRSSKGEDNLWSTTYFWRTRYKIWVFHLFSVKKYKTQVWQKDSLFCYSYWKWALLNFSVINLYLFLLRPSEGWGVALKISFFYLNFKMFFTVNGVVRHLSKFSLGVVSFKA